MRLALALLAALSLVACNKVKPDKSKQVSAAGDFAPGVDLASAGNLTCSNGGCEQSCPAGQLCNATCSGGSCKQTCAEGAMCNLTCSGGKCTQACAGKCNKTCSGGGCI
jgi:hypothetical protein